MMVLYNQSCQNTYIAVCLRNLKILFFTYQISGMMAGILLFLNQLAIYKRFICFINYVVLMFFNVTY